MPYISLFHKYMAKSTLCIYKVTQLKTTMTHSFLLHYMKNTNSCNISLNRTITFHPFPRLPSIVATVFIAKCTHSLANEYVTGDANDTFSAVKCSTRLSLIRSVIHAAHREGERDATNWREWPLTTIIATLIWQKKYNDLYVSFLHPCRLYYKPFCRLWWPVAVLSTLLESSKTWMLPQSWKTSRLSFGTAPSSLDDVVVFVPIHWGDMLCSSFAITVT